MKIISLILLMVELPAVSALSSVSFGGLELQLKSSATDKDPETLLVEVLTQTVQFLDGSFTDSLQATDIDFSHIGLSVDTYDIDDNMDESSVIFGFSGTAFFHSSPAPTEDDVHQILVKSFFGRNSQAFTASLMKSSDPFLQSLSYSMVQVNGYVVPGGVPQETAAPQELQSNEGFDFEMIAIIVGSTTGALLFILLCYCFWCAGDPDELSVDATRKTPTQTGQTPIKKSQTSQTDDVEAASAAPSSPQSITSQDSSIFTYNPSSRISFDASTIMSTNTTETNPVDLALWQQRNTIVSSRFAPFGHDISAIEMLNDNKKDLSLIEEGDESATPVKSMEYVLSKDLLSQRERRERSRGRDAGCSFISEQSDNTDVISDLRNLSQQINHYRRR
jgi:hypothetical protein